MHVPWPLQLPRPAQGTSERRRDGADGVTARGEIAARLSIVCAADGGRRARAKNSHALPSKAGGHRQTPPPLLAAPPLTGTQTPPLAHGTAHAARLHAAPVYPAWHAHVPLTQSPCPKHSCAQRRSEQSWPVNGAKHSQPPACAEVAVRTSSSPRSRGRSKSTPNIGTDGATHLPLPLQLLAQPPLSAHRAPVHPLKQEHSPEAGSQRPWPKQPCQQRSPCNVRSRRPRLAWQAAADSRMKPIRIDPEVGTCPLTAGKNCQILSRGNSYPLARRGVPPSYRV